MPDGVMVVTGAAQGNGAAIAGRLAAGGATVVVADLDETLARSTAERIAAEGLAARALQCDVADEASVERLADAAVGLGRLSAWVNNAGIIDRRPLLEIDVDTWDRLMAVNARGCFLGVRAAGRRMRDGGSIVNLASISSFLALPNTAHYGASKGAVALLTKHAALELAPLGIRVNAVAPGTILTGMTADRLGDTGQFERTLARIPLGRVGEPADVAGVVAFLCGPESAYVNGAVLPVDGGWLVT